MQSSEESRAPQSVLVSDVLDDSISAMKKGVVGVGRTERMIRHTSKPAASASKSTSGSSSSSSSYLTSQDDKDLVKKRMKESIKRRASSSLPLPKLDVSGRLEREEVANRRESSIKTSSTTIKGDGGGTITIEYAYACQRGYYPDGAYVR